MAKHRNQIPCRVLLSVLIMLFASGCSTMLTSDQRQELETQIHSASLHKVFAAVRDTAVNEGYDVRSSDFAGGLLLISSESLKYSPGTAALTTFLLPPVGDIYVGRYGFAILDLLLWPWSVVWATPINYQRAKTDFNELSGTVSFTKLSPRETRVRISIKGTPWDTEVYPRMIQHLHTEIGRQLFVTGGQDTFRERSRR